MCEFAGSRSGRTAPPGRGGDEPWLIQRRREHSSSSAFPRWAALRSPPADRQQPLQSHRPGVTGRFRLGQLRSYEVQMTDF